MAELNGDAGSMHMQAVRPGPRRISSTSMTEVRGPASAPRSQGSPRRYPTVEMPAIDVPRSSGRMLDDDLNFDIDVDADGGLELDCLPSSHGTRVEQPRQMSHEPPSVPRPMSGARERTTSSRGVLPPAPPWPMASAGPRSSSSASTSTSTSSSTRAAVDTHAALVAFAGFGDPPPGIFGAPGYALRVILRRRTLRADLARARLRRSHDVLLYEASLRTADDDAVRMGLVVWGAMLTLGLVFLAAAVQLLGLWTPFG